MNKAVKTVSAVWIIGTVLTVGLAVYLLKNHKPAAAGTVIIISPFPCPPGIPC